MDDSNIDDREIGPYLIKTRRLIATGVGFSLAGILSQIIPLVTFLCGWQWPSRLLLPAIAIMAAALAGPVVGVVCGYKALRRLSLPGAPGRRGALLSVWLGWLSLATLCVATLAPAYDNEYRCHQSVRSKWNLKTISVAIGLYRSDFADSFPPNLQILADKGYVKDTSILRFPPRWDWSRQRLVDPLAIDADADYLYAPLLREPPRPGAVPIAWEKDTSISGRGVNVLFCDLHVSSKDTDELLELLNEYKDYYATTPRPPDAAE